MDLYTGHIWIRYGLYSYIYIYIYISVRVMCVCVCVDYQIAFAIGQIEINIQQIVLLQYQLHKLGLIFKQQYHCMKANYMIASHHHHINM